MTYNFDPDNWYELHAARLERRRQQGELDDAAHDAALEELDRRHEAMLRRLDGTYRIPSARGESDDGKA